jgi:hypothetical protein
MNEPSLFNKIVVQLDESADTVGDLKLFGMLLGIYNAEPNVGYVFEFTDTSTVLMRVSDISRREPGTMYALMSAMKNGEICVQICAGGPSYSWLRPIVPAKKW